jgi:hypothetical protein
MSFVCMRMWVWEYVGLMNVCVCVCVCVGVYWCMCIYVCSYLYVSMCHACMKGFIKTYLVWHLFEYGRDYIDQCVVVESRGRNHTRMMSFPWRVPSSSFKWKTASSASFSLSTSVRAYISIPISIIMHQYTPHNVKYNQLKTI